MSTLDTLKTGLEILTGGKNILPENLTPGGLFSKVLEIAGLKKRPDIAEKAEAARKAAEKDRAGVFESIGKSVFMRQFPRLSAFFDLIKAGKNITEKGLVEGIKESFKDFGTATALLMLIPDSLKHYITDLFADSEIFQNLVKRWPGLEGADLPLIGKGGPLRDKILREKDPKSIILALRVMHQDVFVTGKVSFEKVKEYLGTVGAITVTAGVAALGLREPSPGVGGDGSGKD